MCTLIKKKKNSPEICILNVELMLMCLPLGYKTTGDFHVLYCYLYFLKF